MTDRWSLQQTNGSHQLFRAVEGKDVVVGYLDPVYAREIVDALNGVPILHLQKQVAVMSDQVEDILDRVTKLGRQAAGAWK